MKADSQKWCRYTVVKCCEFIDCSFKHFEDYVKDSALTVQFDAKDKKSVKAHVKKALDALNNHHQHANKAWLHTILGQAFNNVNDDASALSAVWQLLDEFQIHLQKMRHWNVLCAVFTHLYPFFETANKHRSGTGPSPAPPAAAAAAAAAPAPVAAAATACCAPLVFPTFAKPQAPLLLAPSAPSTPPTPQSPQKLVAPILRQPALIAQPEPCDSSQDSESETADDAVDLEFIVMYYQY
ncbi:hypothetical protein DIPPA_03234 [Diplonema papillatum]|nr:hypothetical protein DIPPA_03234 [Diplonema papillatum]